MTHTDKQPETTTPVTDVPISTLVEDASRTDSVQVAQEMRRQAEDFLQEKRAEGPKALAPMSADEIERAMHELRVHQIELEMQNEELRKTQAELDATRARYFNLYDLAPVGYCTISKQGMLQELNLTASNLLGVARGRLAVQPIFSHFIKKEDQDIYYLYRKKLFETGNPQTYELRMVKEDGGTFWAHLSATVAQDEDGKPICHVVISDITDRKLMEEALRGSEEKYRVLVNNLSSGVVVHAPDSSVLFSNPMASTLLGLTDDQMQGKVAMDPAWNFLREDGTTVPLAEYPVNRVLSSGESISNQVLGINRPDRIEPVWVLCNAFPMMDKEAQLVQVVVSFSDITKIKQAENEQLKLEAQLQQSQKMESVGRLAGGVAHDFNNMLGVILGHTEMALDEVDPTTTVYEDLKEILMAANRSADLTRQLLAFARKQTVSPKVLDLNATVMGMLKMLRRLIGEDIDLAWMPGSALWAVSIDPSQIDQMLANLCVNARDSIADVGRITIETGNCTFDEAYCADHPGFTAGAYVRIAVSDTGCGMDKETQSHIFEPFYTTKGIGEGTGLGLSTVYGAVKQNNGFITVYSEPGQGTTFTIYLPRHKGKPRPITKDNPAAPDSPGNETILLVEDEPSILKLTKMMLTRQGYSVLAASTPAEAIRLAREHPGSIHLIMTDVVMPEMNGRDLSRSIQAFRPDIKRLFMSGYTADVIAHQGVLDQGVHFIQKPFSKKDLIAKVHAAIESK